MASLISKPKRQTLEEVVQSFRTNSMDRELEAVKKRLETRTNAMTASLATDSMLQLFENTRIDQTLSESSVKTMYTKIKRKIIKTPFVDL